MVEGQQGYTKALIADVTITRSLDVAEILMN